MKTSIHSAFALSLVMLTSAASATDWQHYSQFNSGLPSNATTSVHTSDSGAWIGTEAGVAHYNGSAWMNFTTANSAIPSNQINDIHVDAEGAVWAATYEGLAVYRDRTWATLNTENSMLPTNLIRCINSDSDGNLWIGTWGGGLVRFGSGGWEVYTAQNSSLPSNGIYDIAVDDADRIWVGTHAGGAALLEAGGFTVFDTQNSELPSASVRSVAVAEDGTIWLGTENGLAHLTLDGEVEWEIYTSLYFGYSVHAFRDITTGPDGTVLFATDAGLFQFNGQTFHIMNTTNSEIASNNCVAVAADQNGNIIVAHPNHGISVHNPNGVTLSLRPVKTQLNMEVYPNPTTDGLTVKIPLKGDGQFNFTVTDLAGRTVVNGMMQAGLNGQTVDVSGLSAGNYMLTVRSANEIASAPFVKW